MQKLLVAKPWLLSLTKAFANPMTSCFQTLLELVFAHACTQGETSTLFSIGWRLKRKAKRKQQTAHEDPTNPVKDSFP